MDKNKSRTDLLAAGRKKLQQFRQKKDNKGSGSQGKSTKKSGKSEQREADAFPSETKPTTLPQASEGAYEYPEDGNTEFISSSGSHSGDNRTASETNDAAVGLSEVTITHSRTIMIDRNTESPSQEVEVHMHDAEPSVKDEEESTGSTNAEQARAILLNASHAIDSGGQAKDANISVPIDASMQSASVDIIAETCGTVETECLGNEEKSLPSRVNTSLMQEREDQVTDEGDARNSNHDDEAEVELKRDNMLSSSDLETNVESYSGQASSVDDQTSKAGEVSDGLLVFPSEGKQSNLSREAEVQLEGDKSLLLSELDRTAGTFPNLASSADEQTGKVDEASLSFSATMSDGFSVSALALPEADGSLVVSAHMENQRKREDAPGSGFERLTELQFGSGFLGGEGHRAAAKDGLRLLLDDCERPPESIMASPDKEWTAPPVADASSIGLSQLTEVIRRLSEQDLWVLLNSIESVPNAFLGTTKLIVQENGLLELFERLKEELILANFTKDLFHLQLAQQSEMQVDFECQRDQLLDETSLLRASLNEVSERNQLLAEELVECRCELQAVASGREEIQNQLHTVKAEVEQFSAREIELQSSLERSQQDLLGVSEQLADCQSLVAALQIENENLNGSVASWVEDRKTLVEKNDLYLHEKEKLSADLLDCESSVAAFQGQISNLTRSLDSETEERTKLEEENEQLSSENEKLAVELSDSKNLVLNLQVENDNLNGSLAFVTEERKMLEGEKDYSAHEIERLSAELLVLQERMSAEHGEHRRVEVDLKETMARLEELTEENSFLSSSQDMLQAKLREDDKGVIQIPAQAGESGNQVELSEVQSRGPEIATENEDSQQFLGKQDSEASFIMVEKPLYDGCGGSSPFLNLGREVFDDSYGFVALKGRLEEADNMLNKLVQEIEGICAHSEFLNRSEGKVSIPPVSKLIQAFESKAHLDEHDVEEQGPTGTQSPGDSIASVREETGNLRALFGQMLLDVANASVLLKEEQDGRKIANITIEELKDQYEALEEYSKKLEATNIELGVLYEALEQHRGHIETRNSDLVVLCESFQRQVTNLKAENMEVGGKLHGFESSIGQLQSQLHDLHLSTNDTVSQISSQLENLHKGAAESLLILDRHWNSTLAPVGEAIGKLDASLGSLTATTTVSDGSVISHFATSVFDAISVIEDLKDKLECSQTDCEALRTLYIEVKEKCDDLYGKNELASGTLRKLYVNLSKLLTVLHGCIDEREVNPENEILLDPLDSSIYETIIEQLENLLSERLQLVSVNKKLNSELMDRVEKLEVLKQRCLDSSAIQKLIEEVEGVLKLEDAEVQADEMPASRLESLVLCLVRRCEEADMQVDVSKEGFHSKVMELTLMQEELQQLNASCLQHESETIVLRESFRQVEEDLLATRSELEEKLNELEQSEQRVSSLREKLSIAVSKGKGLIVQRDGLKQSLAEKSNELERCLQELQLKDSRIFEVEIKHKEYSEAGERVEALESELSYIRNSATALRESFLLKDSVLQRIEEILEDLDLPEHFHSRDILEKIDWLARSATGSTFPLTNSDQKSSGGGGSHSDAGFVVMESWKDDAQPSSDSSDDLKRKYDELQSKFYGLAEQNEMLDQSLMERNNIVQRWEEVLDRIDMPSHLQSMEPEDKIEWLRKALVEGQDNNMSLQQKVVNLENYSVALNADLEDSRRRISDLEADIQTFMHERNNLSQRLEVLTNDHDNLSTKAAEFELVNEKLQEEVTDFQENVTKMHEDEKQLLSIQSDIRRLQVLITDALQDPETKAEYSGEISIEYLEGLLNKLLENHATFTSGKSVCGGAAGGTSTDNTEAPVNESRSVSYPDTGESDTALLKKELEEVQREILDVKEERDEYLEKQLSLARELEALDRKVNELQGLLNQEEQKSASVREKLTIAVRKGKQLMQQRESLKQNFDEINSVVEHLRSEIRTGEHKLAEYEQKFRDLSTYPGRVEALESESLFLRNCLNETEHSLQEKGNTLTLILNTLGSIDVGDTSSGDPVLKLEQVGKMCCDLRTDITSSEQEARKSKRAAELLLAELNEVQERNDSLQEELAKSESELSILSKERDLAQATKLEALSRLEELSNARSEERQNQFSDFSCLKSGVDQLRNRFNEVNNLLASVFHLDLQFFQTLETGIESCLKAKSTDDVPLFTTTGGFIMSKSDKENIISMNSRSESNMHGHSDDNFVIEIFNYVRHYVQELMMEVGMLKEKLDEHSFSLHEKTNNVSKLIATVHGELTSKNESLDALKRDLSHMERVEKEKDEELLLLRRNIALIFEACTSSVMEMGRRKAELVANGGAAGDLGMRLKSADFPEGGLSYTEEDRFRSEEYVRTMRDGLLSTVSDFGTLTAQILEGSQKELKITISKLQKELQEKDIQKERICMELVSQIKGAEATANSYSKDLQSSKTMVYELEKHVKEIIGERDLLVQRVKELEDGHATSTELEQRVISLTDVIASKDQENEDLMQALDDEEVQMQGLTLRIKELEKVVEQKNLDLENLESSRGKVMKKLSITVGKFDELHILSANLLAEVEKLQSQLQDRDAEVSFLRQEVTRCTNDVLVSSQVSNKRSSDEIHEFLTWFDLNIARVGMQNAYLGDENNDQVSEHKEILKKKIDSVISELGDLRTVAQSKEMMLQVEKSKVEELTRKGETLAKSLHEKESQLNLLEGVGDSGQGTSITSEIVEVEPAKNNWAVSGTSIAPQVRSLRKGNSDQVAVSIDIDSGTSGRFEDEDDDKVHGFKSLTTSRIVPRFTRPVTDMVDGLWVSCDRTFMRKPALRLALILYWAVLHALLASFAI